MSQLNNYNGLGSIVTITGDAGGLVSPDVAGNLGFTGSGVVTVTGTPLTNSLDITVSGAVSSQFDTDVGSAIPALGVLTVAGGTNINSAGAGSTVTLNLDAAITLTTVNATTFDTNVATAGVTLTGASLIADGTDADIDINITPKGTGALVTTDIDASNIVANGVVVGIAAAGIGISGTTLEVVGTDLNIDLNISAKGTGDVIISGDINTDLGRGIVQSSATGIFSSSEGTDGQLLVSSSIGAPIFANITSTGGSLSVGNGANTINIDITGTTDHCVQVGSATGTLGSLGIGTASQILQSGGAGANPNWSTATYPSTVAIGDILVASAANTITSIVPATATYVLTANGVGAAPTFQAQTFGTVTSVSGGVNISASGTAADPVMDLDAALTGMTSATFATGGSLQTGTTATNSLLIQAYDVDGITYVPFITLTAANDPTCDLAAGVTIGTSYIYRASGTDIPIADGGTNASTLLDHGVLCGSGATDAITPLTVGTDGQVLLGSSAADPVFATLSSTGTIAFTQGAGTLALNCRAASETETGVVELAIDAESIAGTASTVINCTSLKAKLGAQTSHGIAYGAATTGAVAWTAEMTDGQLLIGDTGGVPIPATLTAGTGVQITNAAGSVTVASTGTSIKNEVGTTYTLIIGDAGKYFTFSNAAAIACTIPTNAAVALPIGTQIGFQQLGAGKLTFSGAGTTLQSADTALTTVKQYSVGYMIKTATDTWNFGGDLEA